MTWEWHRLCQPSTFILSYSQSDYTRRTPELRELVTTPAACIQPSSAGSTLLVLLCMELEHFTTLDSALPHNERIRWSWIRTACTSCGPRNTVTIITSQLWVEEVAWLSKSGISSYTILSSSLALVSRSVWRILITACWLNSRRITQILLKTHQKVEKYWQRKLMMTPLETLTTSTNAFTTI